MYVLITLEPNVLPHLSVYMSSKFLCNQKLLIAVKMGNSMQKTEMELCCNVTTRHLSQCITSKWLESTISNNPTYIFTTSLCM